MIPISTVIQGSTTVIGKFQLAKTTISNNGKLAGILGSITIPPRVYPYSVVSIVDLQSTTRIVLRTIINFDITSHLVQHAVLNDWIRNILNRPTKQGFYRLVWDSRTTIASTRRCGR